VLRPPWRFLPCLGQMRPVHVIPSYVFKSHFNIFQSMTGSSKQVSPPKSCMHLSSTPCMSYALLTTILLHLITQITDSNRCKLWISSLCHFSNLLVLSPSLAQILSTMPKSLILSPFVLPLIWGIKFHTHIKQQEKLRCHITIFMF